MTMQANYLRYGYKRHGPGGPVLLIAALLLMLAAPLALAGPDCDKRPDHPSCAEYTPVHIKAQYLYFDGVDFLAMEEAEPWAGPNHPWTTPAMWFWDDYEENTLTRANIPRPCVPGDVTYGCSEPEYRGGRISIDMSLALGWAENTGKKQRYPEFCYLLNDWSKYFEAQRLTFGITGYGFVYEDHICSRGDGCDIRVATFSRHAGLNPFNSQGLLGVDEVIADYGNLPDVGTIDVFGLIDNTPLGDLVFPGTPNEKEGNPFTLDQLLSVDRLEIRFFSGRMLASCETELDPGIFLETQCVGVDGVPGDGCLEE
jgi:hypothetical protein